MAASWSWSGLYYRHALVMITQLLLCFDHGTPLHPPAMPVFVGNDLLFIPEGESLGSATSPFVVANLATVETSFGPAILYGVIIVPTTFALGLGICIIT